MSPVRVGVAADGAEIVAVRLRKRAEPQVVAERLQEGEPLAAAVARLLDVLGAKTRRTVFGAVVGNGAVRVGELFGVAAAVPESEVRAVLHAEPTSFFVGVPGSLIPGEVWSEGDGWYGVVADRGIAESLTSIAAARRCQFAGLAPYLGFESLTAAAEHAARIGPGTSRVVDVLATERAGNARRLLRGTALGAGSLLLLAGGLVPMLTAVAAERAAATLVARAREARDVASARVASLADQAPLLSAVAAVDANRARARNSLEALARALPDSSAVVWLEWRHGAATAEIVGADGAEIVGALARDSALAGLKIDGTISRETVLGSQRDRIRVAWGVGARERSTRGFR